ncbi:hypothetical protein [Amylibacter marinus]|nr:hypothetical protein [Amylibacter marinus]
MVDKNSPISGLAVAVIGIACLAWVHVETEGEITFDKVPDALFRVIGKLN